MFAAIRFLNIVLHVSQITGKKSLKYMLSINNRLKGINRFGMSEKYIQFWQEDNLDKENIKHLFFSTGITLSITLGLH